MYTFIIVIHVIACFILIASILLQSGRGGGLSDLFGAGSAQTIFGTRAPKFLTRLTTTAAIIFLLSCITLTIFSSRRSRSLLKGKRMEAEEAQEKTAGTSEAEPQLPQE